MLSLIGAQKVESAASLMKSSMWWQRLRSDVSDAVNFAPIGDFGRASSILEDAVARVDDVLSNVACSYTYIPP